MMEANVVNSIVLELLEASKGKHIGVLMKNGETYDGVLGALDHLMNLHLMDVVSTSKDGDRFHKINEVYLAGANIAAIHAPSADEMIGEGRINFPHSGRSPPKPAPNLRAPVSRLAGERRSIATSEIPSLKGVCLVSQVVPQDELERVVGKKAVIIARDGAEVGGLVVQLLQAGANTVKVFRLLEPPGGAVGALILRDDDRAEVIRSGVTGFEDPPRTYGNSTKEFFSIVDPHGDRVLKGLRTVRVMWIENEHSWAEIEGGSEATIDCDLCLLVASGGLGGGRAQFPEFDIAQIGQKYVEPQGEKAETDVAAVEQSKPKLCLGASSSRMDSGTGVGASREMGQGTAAAKNLPRVVFLPYPVPVPIPVTIVVLEPANNGPVVVVGNEPPVFEGADEFAEGLASAITDAFFEQTFVQIIATVFRLFRGRDEGAQERRTE